MNHRIKSNAKFCAVAVLAILAVAQFLSARSARATVLDMDSLVALNAGLLHQYTFEGASTSLKEQDKKGTLHLGPVTYGSATASDIQFQTGFDATSMAVITARPGGDLGTDFGGEGGAGLSSKGAGVTPQNIVFPGTHPNATFEMLVRPDQSSVSGTNGGLGYVAMTREDGGVRGYFLFQGSASGSGVDSLTTLAGSSYTTSSEQTAVSNIDPGHWYYFATTYDSNGGSSQTTITSYVADLTLGETALTSLGSTNAPGIFTSGGGGAAPLGVGIGDATNISGGILSAFPGGIDSLGIYTGLLNENTLQSHLDALWLNNQPISAIPEPSTCWLLLSGLALLRRKRKRTA